MFNNLTKDIFYKKKYHSDNKYFIRNYRQHVKYLKLKLTFRISVSNSFKTKVPKKS